MIEGLKVNSHLIHGALMLISRIFTEVGNLCYSETYMMCQADAHKHQFVQKYFLSYPQPCDQKQISRFLLILQIGNQ